MVDEHFEALGKQIADLKINLQTSGDVMTDNEGIVTEPESVANPAESSPNISDNVNP